MDTRQFVKRTKAPKVLDSAPIKPKADRKRKRKLKAWLGGFGGVKAVERMLEKPSNRPANQAPEPKQPVQPDAKVPDRRLRMPPDLVAQRHAEIRAEYAAKGKKAPNPGKIPPWHLPTSRHEDVLPATPPNDGAR